MECKKEKKCNCTADCELKGLCCECVAKHRKMNQLPACYFSEEAEKQYDRSMDFFLQYKEKGKK